jgi:hypothetical protein
MTHPPMTDGIFMEIIPYMTCLTSVFHFIYLLHRQQDFSYSAALFEQLVSGPRFG